eukprot:2040511-Pleurochrysis_carterae.AAC.1
MPDILSSAWRLAQVRNATWRSVAEIIFHLRNPPKRLRQAALGIGFSGSGSGRIFALKSSGATTRFAFGGRGT